MRRKLIEASLPLDAINAAAAREKSIRHGHPSTLHLWWARRPLAAARAVIFAQMVDDPSEYAVELLEDPERRAVAERELRKRRGEAAASGKTSDSQPEATLENIAIERERERLFGILESLVKWESTTDEAVLERARREIRASWRRTCMENAGHPDADRLFRPDALPAFQDPFAGGGALPLEAQRLGLEAHASDLNPVAVLINKAMIEIPPKFAGHAAVNPEKRNEHGGEGWQGATGLAEDVRHYGQWMRDEAQRRIGHLYPQVEITPTMVEERPDLKPYEGRMLTVIAWLWARTVRSPNPAFADVEVPLASTFMLSTKRGKEAYVEPVIEGRGYRFEVRAGRPADAARAKRGTKLSRGANFQCVVSGTTIVPDHVKAEGVAGRMGSRLMAVVAEGDRGRVYVSPSNVHEDTALRADPEWAPEAEIAPDRRSMFTPLYGMTHFKHLFTPRQLVALTTFSDLVGEASERVRRDAVDAGLADDGASLRDGGSGATAYAQAVALYWGLNVSKQANRSATLNFWDTIGQKVQQVFARQALPMTWDYVEANPFSASSGNFNRQIEYLVRVIGNSPIDASVGTALQMDAQTQALVAGKVVSMDPPYYDNIGYADLADFFYVWLRRSLRSMFPALFATMTVPKDQELVATPHRHGGKKEANTFFLTGMSKVLQALRRQTHPALPVTIYYAFKQTETKKVDGIANTGWETFLEAVYDCGFTITGTWPMRTELTGHLKKGTNSLASSIVLVCRRRPANALPVSRGDFLAALRTELPPAVRLLQSGNIAPVDLAQAAIGPGMAAYTRHAKVLHADGKPVTVREALALINQILDEVLAEQEGDIDSDSRWALAWFGEYGFEEGEFGRAETLSTAKNTSVAGLEQAGIISSSGGKVQLIRPSDMDKHWVPAKDKRLTVWEALHQLVRVHSGDTKEEQPDGTLEPLGLPWDKGGEEGAAALVHALAGDAERARALCYRLFEICRQKERPTEAQSYNALVQSWPTISALSQKHKQPQQQDMLDKP